MDWAKLGSTDDLVRMEIWLSRARLKIGLGLEIWLYQSFGWVALEFWMSWRFHWVLHLLVGLKIWFGLAGKVRTFYWAGLDW